MQQVLDNWGFIGTILLDLSKAYDWITNNLLIAKLECYGVYKASLRLLLDYPTLRKQPNKIGSSFRSWCDIKGQWLVLFYLIYLSMIYFFV